MKPFIKENGYYEYIAMRLETHIDSLRNRALARKLGVDRIDIRSNSFLRGLSYIQIGRNFEAGKGLWLDALTEYKGVKFSPKIIIGDDVSVSFWCHIAAINYIEIGSNVMIGSKVIITDHNHGSYGPQVHTHPEIAPALRPLDAKKVTVGANVWIADGVVIAPGSEIGEGSVIGANAVVTGQIPPFVVAAGIPARPIKKFDFEKQMWVSCS